MTRTARIGGSPTELGALPRRNSDVSGFTFDHLGRRWRFDEMLEATFTDGVMVVVDDVVTFEHYGGCMRPTDTHLLMSVSKSLTSTLAGVLVGQGVIEPSACVPDYIASLRGTAWDGCTLQHLLDMRAGTEFDEDNYDDPDSHGRLIEQISGYTSGVRTDLPANTFDWIAELDNAGRHGGPFQYRSILPDVLAWVMCAATNQTFPDLFSEHIWSHVATRDADIIVDSAGFPVVEGGICTTLEDLARFGLMCLHDGVAGGKQIVPADWMSRPTTRDQDLIDAFVLPPQAGRAGPNACYRDFWWVYDSVAGIYCGLGINGQLLMIHRPSKTVVAKFSTWPDRMDYALADLTDAAMLALCAAA
ncbi:MAG TPA: serine hydrolase [Ilumatobacteraceae bacterium]|nr:serine hydrolase [Ilumatobacteraceae bacterium]